MSPTFDTKVAIVLDESLPTWQKVNVAAFLFSGFGIVGLFLFLQAFQGGNTDEPLLVNADEFATGAQLLALPFTQFHTRSKLALRWCRLVPRRRTNAVMRNGPASMSSPFR